MRIRIVAAVAKQRIRGRGAVGAIEPENDTGISARVGSRTPGRPGANGQVRRLLL
jgi:hypothetical protein